jgi:Asp-tRNA(Asn)/Glu-tRNA(Gln) amidotransferase A subunit family amidase
MAFQQNPKIIAVDMPSAVQAVGLALQAATAPECAHVYLRTFDAQAHASALAADQALACGAPLPALAGKPISIKDLFDVAGHPTTGGSRSMHDAAPAAADCTAVARLRQAGAALIGHTNLSEFAFSGVGINPHHGTPVNPSSPAGQALIPGGSTSGGAVSVAAGGAFAALGSDTGGSIRIPAALQGLVGFKNTQRLTPLDGTIPLSTTLDTACCITRTVADAVLMHGIVAARRPALSLRPLRSMRFAVPQTLMLDGLDPAVAAAFDAALRVLRQAGAVVDDVPMARLGDIGHLQSQGGFAAAESWAWHRERLSQRAQDYDPRVAMRIQRGVSMSAADYIDLHSARRRWIDDVAAMVRPYDAMLSPTVPMQAPAIGPLLASDDAFFAVNQRLLRNPAVVNMLDGCALSLPCHAPGDLPIGLMVWGPALADDEVLSASLAIEAALAGVR